MPAQPTAIIIGAGVAGIATAYALARRGWAVTLADRATGPGQGASYANGAQLSYCYTDALASPHIWGMIPAIIQQSGGLKITPALTPEFASWTAQFLRNCTAERFAENTLAALELAQQSKAAMGQLLDEYSIDFGHRIAGKIHLYATDEGFAAAQSVMALKAPHGCKQRAVQAKEIAAYEPGLAAAASKLSGAIITPDEAVGDSHLFCVRLLDILQRELAVLCRFDAAVEQIDLTEKSAVLRLADGDRISADRVVVCTGTDTRHLLKPLGLAPPILPMKGYSFEMPLLATSPVSSITDTSRRIVFTNLGDRMRVAGLADLGNGNTRVDPDMSRALMNMAQDALPFAGDYRRARNHWAGLRPMTPNSLPVITRPEIALAINAGHGMLGWTMAMGAGERMAKLLEC